MEPQEPNSATSPAIRPAQFADLDQVFAVALEFATSFRPEKEVFASNFCRLIEPHDALTLVAEQSGQIKGYLLGFDHDTFFANGRVAWIEELMVRKEQRRNGIGTQLVEHFERWATSRGNILVALATRRAAPFYAAIGYEESATYYRKLL